VWLPGWSRVTELADAMPESEPGWERESETLALQGWAGSSCLQC